MLTLLLNRHAWWAEAGGTGEAVHFGVWAWITAQRDRTPGHTTGLWNSSFPAIPPFPFYPVSGGCVSVCVCVYNFFVCFCFSGRLGKWERGWDQVSLMLLAAPLLNRAADRRLSFMEERRGGESVQRQSGNTCSVSASAFSHSYYFQTRNCCLGTCCC